jgi:hypothetical protein
VKRCSKCGEMKDESMFYRKNGGYKGLSAQCIICVKIYHEARKDVKSIYDKTYGEAHRAERSIYNKIYNEAHKGEKAIYDKEYRGKNRNSRVLYAKKYREINKDIIKRGRKIFYEENKERILNRQKVYRELNWKDIEGKKREWNRKNREIISIKSANRYYNMGAGLAAIKELGISSNSVPEKVIKLYGLKAMLKREIRKQKEALNG